MDQYLGKSSLENLNVQLTKYIGRLLGCSQLNIRDLTQAKPDPRRSP